MSETWTDAAHPRFNKNMKKPRYIRCGLKIALVQMKVGADKSNNIAEALSQIKQAKEQGAQLVVLPECWNSPYGTVLEEYSEEIPSGITSKALSKAAKEFEICVVGGTIPERNEGKLYSTCSVYGVQGELLATYRKMHLFDIDIPGKITFKESKVLSGGDKITTFDYCGVKIGLGICYDLRFPEMAHLMAKQGCALLIYPSAFTTTTGPKHWELLARGRANDQQLYIALVSPARDVNSPYVAYGHTMLVDPWANIIKSLDENPGTIVADIDLSLIEEVRGQIPIRIQRRTDVYDVVGKH